MTQAELYALALAIGVTAEQLAEEMAAQSQLLNAEALSGSVFA